METKAKKRRGGAKVERAGVLAVERFCHDHDLIYQGAPREDHGVDCLIETTDGCRPTGFLVAGQIKSGASYRRDTKAGGFAVRTDPVDVAYWVAANVPVLFFYNDPRDGLFVRHVQAYLASVNQHPAECRSIPFSDANLAGSEMAEYIKRLATQTPTYANRIEVLGTDRPAIILRGNRLDLSDAEALRGSLRPVAAIRAAVHRVDGLDTGWSVDLEGQVLGFSAKGEWLAYVRSIEAPWGMDCRVCFRHLTELTEFDLPVLTEEDYHSETDLPDDQIESRLVAIEEALTGLSISPALVLEVDVDPLWDDKASEVFVDFGGLPFKLGTEPDGWVGGLTLSCEMFLPARKVRLLGELITPALCFAEDALAGNFESEAVPKTYERIKAIAVDEHVETVAFILATNEENSCWGTIDEQVVTVKVSDLRAAIVDALA